MDRTKMMQILRKYLSGKRLVHAYNTEKEAVKLAELYGVDSNKAAAAGLLHDIAKGLDCGQTLKLCEKYGVYVDGYRKSNPELLHGSLAAALLREKGLNDEEVLSAIASHTTGKKNMSMLDKVVYIADLIEPLRDFPGIDDIRKMAYQDIDEAVKEATKNIITFVLEREILLHPDTVDVYNDMINSKMNEEA